jgi:AraC family transcriptional regulator
MKPLITEPLTLHLIGCVYYGDPFHSYEAGSIKNEIGRLWERFEKIYSKHTEEFRKVTVDEKVAWEAHIQTEEYNETKEYTIFAGMEVSKPISNPIDLFYKKLPLTRYAIFRIKGENFVKILNYIYSEWFQTSKYQESYSYMLWRYDEMYKDLDDPQSELQAYIPVEEKKVD